MQCPQCGTEVKATAIYCQRCGKLLVQRPVAGTPPRTTRPLVAGPPDLPGTADVQATQPVSSVPPPLAPDVLDQVAAAETREMAFAALQSVAAPATASLLSLEPGSTIGTHFRIQRVVEDGPDGPLYEAEDLWTDDRCWSCGAPWNDGDDTRFCEKCGAQRRGKIVLLRQHPLRPDVLTEGATIAPNAIIDGEQMFIIESDDALFLPDAVADPDESAAASDAEEMAAATMEIPTAGENLPPDASVRIARLDLAARDPDPSPTQGMSVPPATIMINAADAFAVSNEESDTPTVEASYFELTTLLPDFMPRWNVLLGCQSDVGQARRGKPNEDTTVALTLTYTGDDPPPPLTLGVVADGLGGHEDGQRAGRLAARSIARYVVQHLWLPALTGDAAPPKDPAQLGTILRAAIQDANAHILKINRNEGGDMGCTVTALIAQGEAACIANVGDSRTYFFDGHVLSRVTTDHSLVARLVAAGMLTPEEVYTHPQRSQIYRSLGDDTELQVDLFPHRLRVGESFVLCSDGLWEMVHDPDIERLLARSALGDPQALARQLVEMANAHGGDDNISVLVAQVVG
jgi:serine/threonine protein phosphatase PrpC